MAMSRADWLPQSALPSSTDSDAGESVDAGSAKQQQLAAGVPLALDGNALANLEVCISSTPGLCCT